MLILYPFGIILTFILIYMFRKTRDLNVLFINILTLELIISLNKVNFGYFFKLGGSELMYDDILLGILFFLSINNMRKGMKFDKPTMTASVMLIVVIMVGIVLLIISPAKVKVIDYSHSWDTYMHGDASQMSYVKFSMQSILMMIRVIIYVFILNTARVIITKKIWIVIGNNVLKFSKIVIVYIVFEAICKFILRYNITYNLISIFGVGICTSGDIDRLQGLSREPAYLALSLFNFCVLCYAMAKLNHGRLNSKDRRWIGIAIFLGLLSASFSFIIVLLGLLGLLLTSRADKTGNRPIYIFFLFLGAIVIFAIVFSKSFIDYASNSDITIFNRLAESAIQIKKGVLGTYIIGQDFSSEASRLIGMIESFKRMLHSPIFGLGIGTTYCVSGVVSILSNVGFLGFFTWMYLIFYKYSKGKTTLTNIFLLFPVLMTSDMYTMYDTSYLLLLPLIHMAIGQSDRKTDYGGVRI